MSCILEIQHYWTFRKILSRGGNLSLLLLGSINFSQFNAITPNNKSKIYHKNSLNKVLNSKDSKKSYQSISWFLRYGLLIVSLPIQLHFGKCIFINCFSFLRIAKSRLRKNVHYKHAWLSSLLLIFGLPSHLNGKKVISQNRSFVSSQNSNFEE